MTASRVITVTGIVQGVGFRPFVYRIAQQHRVAGTVCNTSEGVKITIEGAPEQLDAFLRSFDTKLPPLAKITSMRVDESEPQGIEGFTILPSTDDTAHEALVPPDVSVCSNCLRELYDPADRRYQYPFINCTDCGPRYTIVEDVPYDRPRTSMIDFPMCENCRREYENPLDRRFHAQATCCPDCGPKLTLYDNTRAVINTADPITIAREKLADGKIVAVKGVGGFHLAVDATNAEAVELLRQRKGRGRKPFALMAGSLENVRKFCEVTDAEEQLLTSTIRPILILRKLPCTEIADGVAPNNRYLGVMLPYTPLHRLLLGDRFLALVMTSGNMSDEPIVFDDDAAFERLGGAADFFLTNNRRILYRADDSIAKLVAGKQQTWRRSRGYVPRPITVSEAAPPILACGALMKNTIALTRGRDVFISQHLGDIDSSDGIEFYEDTIRHLQRLLGVTPEIIAYDLHPDYLSTRYALASGIERKIGVQHHIAHVAACQLEHGITDRDVIGFSLDGTGYGLDGNIWGGEIFIGKPPHYERAAHFEYVPMPGGELAVRQPWRMAFSHLANAFDDWRQLPLPLLKQRENVIGDIDTIIKRRLNSPLTSSCGRLFDAVAALLSLADEATFEGEPAVSLEMAATPFDAKPYPYDLIEQPDGTLIIGVKPLIRALVEELVSGKKAGEIAWRFHATIVEILVEIAQRLRKQHTLDTVVMGGGCFLNTILLEKLPQRLRSLGFEVYQPQEVPPGDGSISLGQITIARAV